MEKHQNNELDTLENSVKLKQDLLFKNTVVEHPSQSWWTASDAMTMSSAVLVFGLILVVLATYLLKIGRSADDILKLFGTLIILVAAVFLVVAGYSDAQIAPVIGLLGTIAGYLLGKHSNPK